jgi:hypothetical protein
MDIWNDNSQSARKERWQALWAMEDLPRPIWFFPLSPVGGMAVISFALKQPVTELFTNRETQLTQSLGFLEIAKRIQAVANDDGVLHLQAQMGVGVFASAFGTEIEFPPDQMPTSRFAIRNGEPVEKVYELKPPAVTDGLLGDLLDFAEYFDKKTEHLYPVFNTDLQGPMDTAYLIWDSNDFLVAMYEHPKAVHYLMRLVTDLIIKFEKEYRARVGEFVPAHFPPVYLPDGKGIVVSEDVLPLVSSEHWEEFSLPYINELSEEFGGVIIHSCGNWEHQIESVRKVHNLRGVNFGATETRFEPVWEAFGGKTCVIPHMFMPKVVIVQDFENQLAFVEHVLKAKTTNKGLCIMVYPESIDESYFESTARGIEKLMGIS